MSKTEVLNCTSVEQAKFVAAHLQGIFPALNIYVDGSYGCVDVYIAEEEGRFGCTMEGDTLQAWYCGLGMRHAVGMVGVSRKEMAELAE